MSELTTDDVRVLLSKRFNPPAWALLEEVRNKTGYRGRTERYADAVAMSLYPSRGLYIHGIEIKVSRSDWMRELSDPTKSAPIQRYCDHWWVVVGDTSIVDLGELPPTWGLLVPDKRGTKLVTKVKAPQLSPIPLDRAFLASMLRRASEQVTRATQGKQNDHYQRGLSEGRLQAENQKGYREHRAQQTLERMIGNLKEFEDASGIKIGRYSGKEMGEAVRIVQQHRRQHGSHRKALRRSIEAFELQLESMKVLEQCFDFLDEQTDVATSDPPNR